MHQICCSQWCTCLAHDPGHTVAFASYCWLKYAGWQRKPHFLSFTDPCQARMTIRTVTHKLHPFFSLPRNCPALLWLHESDKVVFRKCGDWSGDGIPCNFQNCLNVVWARKCAVGTSLSTWQGYLLTQHELLGIMCIWKYGDYRQQEGAWV